jgi:hypothetical protein
MSADVRPWLVFSNGGEALRDGESRCPVCLVGVVVERAVCLLCELDNAADLTRTPEGSTPHE